MSQTQPDPDLEQWAKYHDLEPIAYGESKEEWPQRNTALHVGDLAATPKVGALADRDESTPDSLLDHTFKVQIGIENTNADRTMRLYDLELSYYNRDR